MPETINITVNNSPIVVEVLTQGPAGPAGATTLRSVSHTLTNAEIKALPTTEFQLLAAPGAGKVAWPVFANVSLDSSAGAYTNVKTGAALFLWNDAATLLTETGESYPLFADGQAIQLFGSIGQRYFSGGNILETPDYENRAIVLKLNNSPNGNMTGGHADNSLKITLFYVLIDL